MKDIKLRGQYRAYQMGIYFQKEFFTLHRLLAMQRGGSNMVHLDKSRMKVQVYKQFLRLMNLKQFSNARETTSSKRPFNQVFQLKTMINELQVQIECCFVKNHLYLKTASNQTFTIQLEFWSVFELLDERDDGLGFTLYANAQQSYNFYSPNIEQLEQFKLRYSQIGLLRGFYEDFKPIQKIGQGKMSSVFLAINRYNQQKVAVKAFCKKNMQNDSLSTLALKNQIQILKSVNHPSLLKFKRLYETQKSYYAVTEYIEGKTLRKLIETEQLSFQRILSIIRQIVEGLEYLASKGIAHRDVKPENIIVDTQGNRVVIIDFGLAVFCKNTKLLYTHCGTPGFVAPEILDQNYFQVTPQADVFSLGIILHLMLLRKFPYKSASIQSIVRQNKEAQFEFNSQQYENIHPLGIRLLQKMLTKDHRRRISPSQILKCFQQRESWLSQKRLSRAEECPEGSPMGQKSKDNKLQVRSTSVKVNFRGKAQKIY